MSLDRCVSDDNAHQLENGIRLLGAIGDEAYLRCSPHSRRGGIGAHIRHILDHYECFRAGLEAAGFRVVATRSLGRGFGWFVAERTG